MTSSSLPHRGAPDAANTHPVASHGLGAAPVVIIAAVCAAMHVGKLPPAIHALQQTLGMDLVAAGFLLSLVQLAGMLGGIAFGMLADGIGARRSMAAGLLVLALASALGGEARSVGMMMALRALEGFGFLIVVLPGPGLIRRLVAPQRLATTMGLWSTYMPLATTLALLLGPLCIEVFGWRVWWWALAALSLVMAGIFWRAVPAAAGATVSTEKGVAAHGWLMRLRQTVKAPGPWLVAMSFAVYASQWLAVVGFLPLIYQRIGLSGALTGALTALAAAVNMVGNVLSGRLLQRGVRPPVLLNVGFITMALTACAAFAGADGGLPPVLRYLAVLLFSMVGGLIPGTLFATAVRVAPGEQTIASTVGWMQQWSSFGQFAGPPLVAWLASRVNGWHWTWAVTGALSLIGLGLARGLHRLLKP